MKRLAIALMSGMFAVVSLPCAAEPACTKLAVEASVEIGQGELTLADLLAPGRCPRWREAAAQVSLGAAPRPGSARILDGRQVQLLLEALANHPEQKVEEARGMQIPERIVVQRAGAAKSCADIRGFLASAAPADEMAGAPSGWQEKVDCAAARSIPQSAPLELTKTIWNTALRRWEFALRCVRPGDCVPFLVWVRADASRGAVQRAALPAESSTRALVKAGSGGERLVKRGQVAMLTWEQGGIRVVLPVTCLDAGGLGQLVRVRFGNGARTLQAEVVGEGTLRASL
jgi:Chaperone for flagella basal body P-ring formation